MTKDLRHVGKYRALWEFLVGQESDRIDLTFGEIEDILGFPLPNSCRTHPPHWYSYEGSAVGRAIRDAGFRAHDVELTRETVSLRREKSPG